jgi:hypothetical protein
MEKIIDKASAPMVQKQPKVLEGPDAKYGKFLQYISGLITDAEAAEWGFTPLGGWPGEDGSWGRKA